MEKHYGHDIRVLHWCTDQTMTNALAQMELTASQGRIMGYLVHRETAPCSRDVELAFHMSHPTASGLLSRLEKKGFIEFCPDETDKRCKRIYVLEKGWQCHDLMHQTILNNEQRMIQGFTDQEQKQFSDFLQRAIANMGGGPSQSKGKEDA